MAIFISLIMIFFVIYFILTALISPTSSEVQTTENARKVLQNELEQYGNLKQYTFFNNEIVFLDDSNKKMTHIAVDHNYYFDITHFDYNDIIEVSLIMDGEALTSTSRGSQIGGALLGGALFGETGALIGGLSGEKKSKQTVSQIYVKLTLISNENSVKKLIFLDTNTPIDKKSIRYRELYEEAMELEGTFKVIIHKLGQKKNEKKNIGYSSIADELKKLHNLLIEGILTDEEFIIQKQKILSE